MLSKYLLKHKIKCEAWQIWYAVMFEFKPFENTPISDWITEIRRTKYEKLYFVVSLVKMGRYSLNKFSKEQLLPSSRENKHGFPLQ